MFLSSSRDKFTLSLQNSLTDVSVGFRPPCSQMMGSNTATPMISINLSKTFLPISCLSKNCCDLDLGEGLCIFFFFFFYQILDFIYDRVFDFYLDQFLTA